MAFAVEGAAVLSGILEDQAAMVAAAHRECGLKVTDRHVRGEWTTLVLMHG